MADQENIENCQPLSILIIKIYVKSDNGRVKIIDSRKSLYIYIKNILKKCKLAILV